jgi:Tol biopolymer transport system component/DNA-binding winged helix-turn-helix (wHTH) protein
MTPLSRGSTLIRFEAFEANLRTQELFRSGRPVRLPNQAFRILAALLERPGELVSREELRKRVWPEGTHVEYERGLNAAVNRLREALRDSAEAPRFIETLPKRGYRFIAAVQAEDPQCDIAPSPSTGPGDPEKATAAPVGSSGTEPPASGPIAATAAHPPSRFDTLRPRRELLFAAAGVVSTLLIAATIWLWVRPAATQAPSGRRVLPLTSLPGQVISPTFSPDGSQIAFAWNGETGDPRQFDLYVKTLGSERLLRLTRHPGTWIAAAWSPDGRQIAFARNTDAATAIFVIPALGGGERRIVDSDVAVDPFMQIGWSPDGRLLAYSGYSSNGTPQVYVVSLDSLHSRLLSPAPKCLKAGEPAFSPDGRDLALICMSSAAVYAIYLVELPHGPVRQLVSMMGNPRGLAWSSDGSRLIVANDPGDGGELWEVSLKGRLAQLPFGEGASAPAVDPRGGRLAYVQGRKTVDIWRADLTAPQPQGSAVRLIYSTLTQTLPRYSPGARHIAFESNRSGSPEIWITNAQGTDPVQLTSFGGPLTSDPSWCSDGRRIAFDSRASGTSAIYVEDIEERVPRKVLTSQPNLSLPEWSENCRWLFATDGAGRLYRFPASGGPAELFADGPSSYCDVIGDRVVFNVGQPNGVFLWIKAAGGGPGAPIPGMPRLSYGDEWVATRAGIYYTDRSAGHAGVNFYEFASRSSRRLMTLGQTPVPGGGPGLDVSADGRWLLYSQIDDQQSEIALAPAL